MAEKFIPLYMEHAFTDGKLVYATGNGISNLTTIERPKASRKARRKAKRKGAERHVPSKEQR